MTDCCTASVQAACERIIFSYLLKGILHPKMKNFSTQGCVFSVDLRSDLNANSAPLWPGWYRRVYAFCVQGIISKMALRWRRGDVTVPNCWIKSLFLFYFHTKKYSRRFITLRLNHWWQMEYSGDAFNTFLDLDSATYLAVNGTVTSLLV